MKKVNLFLFIIVGFMFCSLVTAGNTYKQGTLLDLKVPYEVNGSLPADNSYCNITIQYPNSDYFTNNSQMTYQNNGEFNISLTSENTSTIGIWEWVAVCCEPSGVNCAKGYDSFEITPSGFGDINVGSGIIIAVSIFSILLLSIVFVLLSFRFGNLVHKIIFLSMGVVMFVIVILYILVILTNTAGGFTAIIEGYTNFWFIIKIAVGIGITAILLFALWMIIQYYNFTRGFSD